MPVNFSGPTELVRWDLVWRSLCRLYAYRECSVADPGLSLYLKGKHFEGHVEQAATACGSISRMQPVTSPATSVQIFGRSVLMFFVVAWTTQISLDRQSGIPRRVLAFSPITPKTSIGSALQYGERPASASVAVPRFGSCKHPDPGADVLAITVLANRVPGSTARG